MSLCPKEKETLKETSQAADIKNRHQKSKCCDLVISKKIYLKLFIYNVGHESNYIYFLLHFFILKFSTFEWNIRHVFCGLILLPDIKISIYIMTDNNSNSSSNSTES